MNAGEHPSTRAGARTGTSAECSKTLPPEAEAMYHSAPADNKASARKAPPAAFKMKTAILPFLFQPRSKCFPIQ